MGIKIFELLLFLYYGSGLIIKIRTCWPIEAYWLGQKDKCLNQGDFFFFLSFSALIFETWIDKAGPY